MKNIMNKSSSKRSTKRIAVITYHRAINYGSVLQTYALNRFLRDAGYSAEVIDYSNSKQRELYRYIEPVCSVKSVMRNMHSIVVLPQLIQKRKRFSSFLEGEIKMTKKKYLFKEELKELNDKYDAYICGSDQIWNPQCEDFDSAYLLDFVGEKQRCISYAPSIAVQTLPQEWKNIFEERLFNFHALSVRERPGCEIIQKIVERHVEWVSDPVFLLSADAWKQNAISCVKSPYVFCYFIGDVQGMRSFSKILCRELKARRVLVNKNLRDIGSAGKRMYSAGPKEFLGLINDSEFICTNSFHAVAFSLIFRKNFWVFVDSSNPRAANSRIFDLLEMIGLQNRIISAETRNKVTCTESIDYSQVNFDKLYEHICKSKEFLCNAIDEISSYESGVQ